MPCALSPLMANQSERRYHRRLCSYVPILAIAVACDGGHRVSSGGAHNRTDAGQTADATVTRPATMCLEAPNCVDNTDCGAGSRCNLALSPPVCQRVLCGGAGTTCSEDGLCVAQHVCSAGVCVPCTQCDGACVDTNTHPRHCGGCGQSVGSRRVCVGGQAACSRAGETLCGTDCVKTTNSSAHCGGCNQDCGGPSSLCVQSQCAVYSDAWANGPITCDQACAAQSLECVVSLDFPLFDVAQPVAGLADYSRSEFVPIPTCSEAPSATYRGETFVAMRCLCR